MVIGAATKEGAVKAGFVYNFTKFTVWPKYAHASDHFHLCVIGGDKLGGGLDALKGKRVASKRLILRHSAKGKAVNTCHMAFIAHDNKANIKKTLNKFSDLPILTVSDSPDFISNGGMIGLVKDGPNVGFEIDVAAAKAVGIHISAQLLKLAKVVKGHQ